MYLPPSSLAVAALALLPFTIGLEGGQRDLVYPNVDPRSLPTHKVREAVGYRAVAASQHRKRSPRPELGVSDVTLNLHSRAESAHERRGGNGSIIALGSSANSYVLPIGLGTPGLAYPLQLDTGSSDLLLASSGCSLKKNACPEAGEFNPYYNLQSYSSSFVAVGNNNTLWSTGFSDGSIGSGFIARERVMISSVQLNGQVFGLMNQTNLTLADQQISGIFGLGFPRLSTLSRVLLSPANAAADTAPAVSVSASLALATLTARTATDEASATSTMSEAPERRQEASSTLVSGSGASASASASASVASAAAPAPTSPYLPPVLESLVSQALIPYPAFGLALSPGTDEASVAASSAKADTNEKSFASDRYNLRTGSLTLGGVSEHYVSANVSSGRTVADIEWHPVMPFAPLNTTGSVSASPSPSPSSSPVATTAASTGVGGVPFTATELDSEQYLYWAIELANVAVNTTVIPLNSTYKALGLPSIATVDVGNNGIYGPQQDVEQIFTRIKDARQVAAGQWAVPCSTQATLGFSFGGRTVTLQPQDWMYAAVAGSSFCLAWPVAAPSVGDGVDWMLGTPFLKNVYTVFSYGINGEQAPQVGFLPLTDALVEVTQPAPSGSGAASVAPAIPITPAAPSITVGTTMPNQLITGPNYPTPSYMFGSPLETGVIQTMGLANASAYAVTAVPVVTLTTETHQITTTTVPDVPGWPGDSAEHATSSAHRAKIAGVLIGAALVAVAAV